jgi:membrane-associated HD superfamily phosphohydrolase
MDMKVLVCVWLAFLMVSLAPLVSTVSGAKRVTRLIELSLDSAPLTTRLMTYTGNTRNQTQEALS